MKSYHIFGGHYQIFDGRSMLLYVRRDFGM